MTRELASMAASREDVERLERAASRAVRARVDPTRASALGYAPAPRWRAWLAVALGAAVALVALIVVPAYRRVERDARAAAHAASELDVARRAQRALVVAATRLRAELPRLRRRVRAVKRYLPALPAAVPPLASSPRIVASSDPSRAARRLAARASLAGIAACVAGEASLARAIEAQLEQRRAQLAAAARHELLGQVAAKDARRALVAVRAACQAMASKGAARRSRRRLR